VRRVSRESDHFPTPQLLLQHREQGMTMIRLTFCLHKLEGLTLEQFHAYWREEHAALVLSKAAELGMKRYVQAHAVHPRFNQALAAARGTMTAYDGIADAWFDGMNAIEALGQNPVARAALGDLIRDEKRFIDLSRSSIFLAEEFTVLG
jgi:hypothetical protein